MIAGRVCLQDSRLWTRKDTAMLCHRHALSALDTGLHFCHYRCSFYTPVELFPSWPSCFGLSVVSVQNHPIYAGIIENTKHDPTSLWNVTLTLISLHFHSTAENSLICPIWLSLFVVTEEGHTPSDLVNHCLWWLAFSPGVVFSLCWIQALSHQWSSFICLCWSTFL